MAIQNLSNIMHKILARGHKSYRSKSSFILASNRDFKTEAAKKGDVINVPISVAKSTRDVTPSNTHPSLTNSETDTVAITLDNWKEVQFNVTDAELAKIDANEHFLPFEIHESMEALAKETNEFLAGKYVEVYNAVGTAGSAPFASDASEAIAARKLLNTLNVPDSNRSIIMNPDAEANALALAVFADASQTGENGVKIDGALGRKYGFMNIWDNGVQSHTAGMETASAVDGAHAVGVELLALTALGTSQPVVGDIFTIAGDSQQYVVTSATTTTSTASDVGIAPPLKIAVSGSEVVTAIGDHVANWAMHRDAMTFAQRPLSSSSNTNATIATSNDPIAGTSLRLEVVRLHKADSWSFDMLYGGKVTRPEAAVRILG